MQSTLADLAPEIQAREMSARAAMPAAAPRRAPETLHPSLWLGHQLGRHIDAVDASGFAVLDAELPGGGWPHRCLTELLVSHPGVGEMRLMAPALTWVQTRTVMLFDPPFQLDAAVLASYGFDLDHLLVVRTRSRTLPGSDSLWSLEQALKSGHVGAVLAWLPPRLRAERLRRLQLAARNHDGVAFVLREASVGDRPSASPLRLSVRAGGVDRLRVSVVKRRGPPLPEALMLDLPSVLSAAARRRSIVAPTLRDVAGKAVTTT